MTPGHDALKGPTMERIMTEADIQDALELITEEMNAYCVPAHSPRTVTHAYCERWTRAHQTVQQLAEAWDRVQDWHAESAQEKRFGT